jgi:SH3-like domain-containing protein
MRDRHFFRLLGGAAVVLSLSTIGASVPQSAIAQANRPPYWASITQVPAIMRRGPSRDMPAIWQYVRDDLPVRVTAVYQDWRRVEDPSGTVGWMHRRLLSAARTAIVTGNLRPMRVSPDASAAIAYRAEPGVVGRISDCGNGWCMLDVKGQAGWIETDHIWGDEAP